MESASLKLPSRPQNANLRAYLAGGGATAALIAAAVSVFLGVATFVGFDGLPFAADDSPGSTVNISAGVPDAAADAAASTAAAVAADPATPSAAAIAEITDALPPGATSDIPGVTPIIPGVDGGTTPPGVAPPGVAPSVPGPVGGVVDEVDDAAGGLGLGDAADGLGLGDATDPITGPIDDTVNDVVNGVGGALGNPNLGNQVNGALNGATNGLLGGG